MDESKASQLFLEYKLEAVTFSTQDILFIQL